MKREELKNNYYFISLILTLGLLIYMLSTTKVAYAADEEAQPCPKPYINTISPNAAMPGEEIKIRGNRFGEQQGSVTFHPGMRAQIKEWTHKRILAIVPEHSETGPIFISLPCDEVSNEVHFTAKEAEK